MSELENKIGDTFDSFHTLFAAHDLMQSTIKTPDDPRSFKNVMLSSSSMLSLAGIANSRLGKYITRQNEENGKSLFESAMKADPEIEPLMQINQGFDNLLNKANNGWYAAGRAHRLGNPEGLGDKLALPFDLSAISSYAGLDKVSKLAGIDTTKITGFHLTGLAAKKVGLGQLGALPIPFASSMLGGLREGLNKGELSYDWWGTLNHTDDRSLLINPRGIFGKLTDSNSR